ncbi:hypothetical protein B0H21DRAFT_736644 [Amylocystis lapponica]|nr:hypothetical protein B0H21DRAFT_736644 [Amylocystis lapponica]
MQFMNLFALVAIFAALAMAAPAPDAAVEEPEREVRRQANLGFNYGITAPLAAVDLPAGVPDAAVEALGREIRRQVGLDFNYGVTAPSESALPTGVPSAM